MKLSGGIALRFGGDRVDIGHDPQITQGTPEMPQCRKNIDMQTCSLDFIKSVAAGKLISSFADFGNYLEFGLEQKFNLGVHRMGFHLVSTENPIEEHRL